MPRLPFTRGNRAVAAPMFCLSALAVAGAVQASTPSPQITALATRGQAPFTVHVHGLNSALGAGDESTARFEWTFGDASGSYNALVGWNAAHIYNAPGTYSLTLKVTNANRDVATRTLQVIVDPPVRGSIYVSPSGNDANSGTSASAPVRTLSRAEALLTDNKAVYLQRGAVFAGSDDLAIGKQNVLVSAYGSGSDPVIRYDNPTQFTKIFQVKDMARDVVIENIVFDSPFTPDNTIVRGMEVRGTNVTVRNCRFGNVSYAITTGGGGAYGLLTQNNVAGSLGAYYCWIEGTDHTHLGNTVAESVDEHNFRFGGASRVLLAYNDLTNADKSAIWCMLGDHCYIANNRLHQGRLIVGPNFAITSPGEHFQWVVAECNEFFGAQAIMYDGAEEVTLRNNIMHADGIEAISIWGYSATRQRTTRDITIANNTVINNDSSYGKCLALGAGAASVTACNNLYAAPNLNGHSGGNVVADDPFVTGDTFRTNLWSVPKVGPRWHVLNESPLDANAWNALAETSGEVHRGFSSADLDSSLKPTFNAGIASPFAGVFTDFYGNPRPASGSWLAGAVQGAGSPPSGSGDVNNDGVVNVNDLLAVNGAWGVCSGCAADTNHDGLVNVTDLLAVITSWE